MIVLKTIIMTEAEDYKNISDNLQTILLVFFGFLLFVVFFILLPYHDLTDRYKVLKNIDFLSDKLNKSSDVIKTTLKNYTANDPTYQKNVDNIDNLTAIYSNNLYKAKESFNNIGFKPIKNQIELEIENKTHPSIPYANCYRTYSNFGNWISCNVAAYSDDQKDKKNIIINSSTTQVLNNNFSTLQDSIKKIQSNNYKYNFIENKKLDTWNDVIKSLEEIRKKNSNNGTKLTYRELHKISNIGNNLVISSIAPTIGMYKNDIKKQIEAFNEDIQSLQFPLVGNAPFTLSQAFLSFPAVIGIVFPFISLQFKKLIKAHLKLPTPAHKANHLNEQQTSLSWLDPFQGGIGKIYAILIIVLPLILLTVFLIIINDIWYTNIEYVENYSILADHSSLIPQNKDDIMRLSALFSILFLLSYIPLIKYAIGKG